MPRERGCQLDPAGDDGVLGLGKLSVPFLFTAARDRSEPEALSICCSFCPALSSTAPSKERSPHAGPVGCLQGMRRLRAETREGEHEDRKGWGPPWREPG